jgi:hypothetical protein
LPQESHLAILRNPFLTIIAKLGKIMGICNPQASYDCITNRIFFQEMLL